MLDFSALEPPTLHSLPSSVEPHLLAAPGFPLPAVADVSSSLSTSSMVPSVFFFEVEVGCDAACVSGDAARWLSEGSSADGKASEGYNYLGVCIQAWCHRGCRLAC
jgi:hypothetical protein